MHDEDGIRDPEQWYKKLVEDIDALEPPCSEQEREISRNKGVWLGGLGFLLCAAVILPSIFSLGVVWIALWGTPYFWWALGALFVGGILLNTFEGDNAHHVQIREFELLKSKLERDALDEYLGHVRYYSDGFRSELPETEDWIRKARHEYILSHPDPKGVRKRLGVYLPPKRKKVFIDGSD